MTLLRIRGFVRQLWELREQLSQREEDVFHDLQVTDRLRCGEVQHETVPLSATRRIAEGDPDKFMKVKILGPGAIFSSALSGLCG